MGVDNLADGDDHVFVCFGQGVHRCGEGCRGAKLAGWNHDCNRAGEVITAVGGHITVDQCHCHRLAAGHGQGDRDQTAGAFTHDTGGGQGNGRQDGRGDGDSGGLDSRIVCRIGIKG